MREADRRAAAERQCDVMLGRVQAMKLAEDQVFATNGSSANANCTELNLIHGI